MKMLMTIQQMKPMINKLYILIILFVSGCSLAPGMHMDLNNSWLDDEDYVYIESLDANIKINSIHEAVRVNTNEAYRIGKGDQISITVWGIPDVFPLSNINPEQNLRRVDSKGDVFFPYVGTIQAAGKTQEELRLDLSNGLSKYFNDPQLDVTIIKFNSQNVYLLGEVTTPMKINITDIPLSLSEALGQAKGLNTNTASGSEVFVIRQANSQLPALIYRANLSSPAGFVEANNFYLVDNDIVYVNARGTTRWNKVISQFFPFSSFLNSIDNLTSD